MLSGSVEGQWGAAAPHTPCQKALGEHNGAFCKGGKWAAPRDFSRLCRERGGRGEQHIDVGQGSGGSEDCIGGFPYISRGFLTFHVGFCALSPEVSKKIQED